MNNLAAATARYPNMPNAAAMAAAAAYGRLPGVGMMARPAPTKPKVCSYTVYHILYYYNIKINILLFYIDIHASCNNSYPVN